MKTTWASDIWLRLKYALQKNWSFFVWRCRLFSIIGVNGNFRINWKECMSLFSREYASLQMQRVTYICHFSIPRDPASTNALAVSFSQYLIWPSVYVVLSIFLHKLRRVVLLARLVSHLKILRTDVSLLLFIALMRGQDLS